MKTYKVKPVLFLIITLFYFSFSKAQKQKEPWKESQLIKPSELFKILSNSESKKPIIFNIGPAGSIKNSIFIGDGNEKDNLEKLKSALNKLSYDADIVIYCGCCPFDACPNIRPVFQVLNDMNFINAKLLNLPKNFKVDWIDKGFSIGE